jgi:hypothetical protein
MVFAAISKFFYALFAATLGLTLIGIAGLILVRVFKCVNLKLLIYVFWFLFSYFLLISWALSCLYGLGMILYQGCKYLKF